MADPRSEQEQGPVEAPAAPAPVRKGRAPAAAVIPPGLGRLQGVVALVTGWAFRWFCRLKVRGREHVPRSGPVIVAANHRSMLDVPLIVLASPRRVHFMAKAILFENRLLAWAFHGMGGFPVRRDRADRHALEVAAAILGREDVVGIYPEGTRSKTEEMLPFMGGVAWLALRTGAPIVPCGIAGTERGAGHAASSGGSAGRLPIPRRRDVTIRFGAPIVVEQADGPRARREQLPALTTRVMSTIDQLAQRSA
jgi:1-acyl-sn-glycerol-3-phosphate acyltransferase